MRYHVRMMRQEDALQMAEIALEAFPTMQPPTNYQREFRNPLAHYIVAMDKPSVSSVGGSRLALYMVGYAGFWLLAGEAHIVDVAVRDAYRRQGIGELLIICIIDLALALNASQATLEVRASNQQALSLYNKYGFQEQGRRRRYYVDNNEDAIIMTLEDLNCADFLKRFEVLKEALAARWGFTLYPLVR